MFYGVCPYTSKMRSQSKLESDGWDYTSHSIVGGNHLGPLPMLSLNKRLQVTPYRL